MTENNNINPVDVISKWEKFAWNFQTTEIEFNGGKETVPQFILDIDWPAGRHHMISKWAREINSRREGQNASDALHTFWNGLDETNRRLLWEYAATH